MRTMKITPFTKIDDVKATVLSDAPWYVRYNADRSNKVIELAWEWVKAQPKMDFVRKKEERRARKECKEYVREKYKGESTFFFGGFLLNILINAIISWIVRRLLDHLFS